MKRTEFYEVAVKSGFYGIETSGLSGKKDNVRKYWEDTFIRVAVRSAIQDLVASREGLRIIDLGSGSGEGYDLLTHIPPSHPVKSSDPFVVREDQIRVYEGVDISPGMVAQGRANYQGKPNVRFMEADLSKGFLRQDEPPYDVYFSSYCSLSHLSQVGLERLSTQILAHAGKGSIIVYDVYGRCSPEWPGYWNRTAAHPLPYTMAYLLPLEQQDPVKIDWFPVTFWSGEELERTIRRAAVATGKTISVLVRKDRSVLVGRHMDTALFKPQRLQLRTQVNRLFDRGYRGDVEGMRPDVAYLDKERQEHPDAWARIFAYYRQWIAVVDVLEALMQDANDVVKQVIESSEGGLSEELKMLAWLYRNADRFPVSDFWASVMGPQVACVLRNLEYNLPDGIGCGHSLLCVVRVDE
ncbi:MAG TPA: class I SAM-dependent methyltransferase [Candidatus Hydrogenedentes bacterium]|nr:class I SAM-dependent methyltransferase [Candidatus Hydrogenedentota bacterium]